MKLFVIGATGRTGREIVHQALARGHHVTAFVRSPESVAARNERLKVINGNAMDENQLADAIQNHDVALVNTPYETKVKPPSDLTPQLVKRVRKLYEELGRQEVRAVEEMEEAERKNPEAETKK